ncbi:MAG: hypothetical protein ACR2H6_06950 [Pyrinomonadaceae bacterium]
MKRFAIAIALVCVLAGTAFAGDIPCAPVPPPPAASPAETEGDMGAGGFAEEITDEIVLAIFGIFAG